MNRSEQTQRATHSQESTRSRLIELFAFLKFSLTAIGQTDRFLMYDALPDSPLLVDLNLFASPHINLINRVDLTLIKLNIEVKSYLTL